MPEAAEPGELDDLAGRITATARRLGEAASASGGHGAASRLGAVRLASELAALSASALHRAVQQARAAGHTWQELGDLLGVSRQAAFQRFGRPVDPRTGAPMSNAILPGAGQQATDLMVDYIEGRYDQVIAHFDATLSKQMPAERLAAAWAQVIGLAGRYEQLGEPLVRQFGDYTVVDIPLSFEAGEMKGRVSYHSDGQVAGLFILTPEAP